MVHLRFARIGRETGDEKSAFRLVQELCGFGPVGDPELSEDTDDECEEAFDNKDPANQNFVLREMPWRS